ncbi:MAG: hypothetical protein NTZ42_02920 [Candidatus Gribaldobacteria bacterium]|nr:hypothetical protein [Candidatus Gribaldobacteria bacterium]
MKKILLLSFALIAVSLLGIGESAQAVISTAVNTLAAESVTTNTATLRGSLVNTAGSATLPVWFEYGPTTDYGTKTEVVTRGAGEYTIDVTKLTPNTTYHFRAGTSGGAYGSDRVFITQSTSFEVKTDAQNMTLRDSVWYSRMRVQPGDFLKYRITIHSTADIVLQDIMVNYRLPSNVTYQGNLMIKGEPYSGDIVRGTINVGNLLPGDSKVITFEAQVGPSAGFARVESILTSTATAFNSSYSSEGACQIIITGTGAAPATTRAALTGAGSTSATNVSTGIGGGLLTSLLLPLLLAGLLVWLFRSRLLGLEEWAQIKKERTNNFRASKKLQRKIAEMKNSL